MPKAAVVPSVGARPIVRTRPVGWRRLDAIAVVALAALSAVVAGRYVSDHFALSYDSAYRDCTEDLLYPCVGRPGWTIDSAALESSAAWQAFARGRSNALACDALQGLPRVSAGHLSEVERYLHASMSAAFSLFGPRRSVYVGYMTVMFVLTIAAAYALFRLAARPAIAFLVTLPFVFSALHLQNALHPAEYVKAPFFLGCLFLVGAIVRGVPARRALMALAAAAGVVAGVGIGFKTDVLIAVPIAIVAIGAFAPATVSGRGRVLAALVFLGAVLASGWPVLRAQFLSEYGSMLPIQVLGGMNRNFDDYYAAPSLYDYGVRFDDTHITHLINSYDQRVSGSRGYSEFYSKQLQRAATAVVADVDRTFPADAILRWFAAIVDVLKLAPFGTAAAVVVTAALLITSPRLGVCIVFLLCTAIGYVSVVFQTKHFFHLEWVPWWFTAAIVERAVRLAAAKHPVDLAVAGGRLRPWLIARAPRLGAIAALIAAVGVAFVAARQLQQRRVTALIADSLRHADDEPLRAGAMAGDEGTMRVSVEGLGSAPHPTALTTDYLVLDVDCGSSSDTFIVGVYEQATSPRERMRVPCSQGALHWKLFWPVYQAPPASRFRWFESGAPPVRIRSIHRIDGRRQRLLLKLAVPDDYQQRRWYHTLRRRFFVDPLGVSQTS